MHYPIGALHLPCAKTKPIQVHARAVAGLTYLPCTLDDGPMYQRHLLVVTLIMARRARNRGLCMLPGDSSAISVKWKQSIGTRTRPEYPDFHTY